MAFPFPVGRSTPGGAGFFGSVMAGARGFRVDGSKRNGSTLTAGSRRFWPNFSGFRIGEGRIHWRRRRLIRRSFPPRGLCSPATRVLLYVGEAAVGARGAGVEAMNAGRGEDKINKPVRSMEERRSFGLQPRRQSGWTGKKHLNVFFHLSVAMVGNFHRL